MANHNKRPTVKNQASFIKLRINNMKKIIINYSVWEYGEYVITMRPENEKEWKQVPIGRTLSKDLAKEIAIWLHESISEIQKIIIQIEED